MEGTNKTLHAPVLRGKDKRPDRRLSQTCLCTFEGLLWTYGLAVACCGDRDAGSSSPGGAFTVSPHGGGHWPYRKACRPQDWVNSKQLSGRRHSPTHQEKTVLMIYWARKALSTRVRPSFPHSQSLPSGSLHTSLNLIHQKADRTKNYNPMAS